MMKSLIIEFDPQDESLLLALFKKLKVKSIHIAEKAYEKGDIISDTLKTPSKIILNDEDDLEEQAFVQNALQQKYVLTGQWEQKTDDERQDLVLAEMMLYEQQRSDYKIMTAEESETFYTTLKKQLYANTAD